ncbi:hypothetical protein [Chryseobacterium indoltheticum]|jgi:hypothetical protein|uniref:hypothetical protein n=1 Tax=Chryseobacterium indoltheticum TaxID=254 RepID=UPI0024301D55|nr:hypothetical protein [Chryseobacterium indoltheticum]MDF2833137.1 hypothetical protein [Chryseobacterium indoltheticum]
MDTPRFCKVGDRPVKALLEDDGFGVYVFDWKTGNFILDLTYLEIIYFGRMDDVEILSEQEFNIYVEKLKKERGLS